MRENQTWKRPVFKFLTCTRLLFANGPTWMLWHPGSVSPFARGWVGGIDTGLWPGRPRVRDPLRRVGRPGNSGARRFQQTTGKQERSPTLTEKTYTRGVASSHMHTCSAPASQRRRQRIAWSKAMSGNDLLQAAQLSKPRTHRGAASRHFGRVV